jgi:PilZ domain-containing protein
MTSEPSRISEAGQKIIERAMKERRRFRRVHFPLTGRLFIPATQEEASCAVQDISPGDAAIICELKQEPKGRAVIYLESLGRFEGPIVRGNEGGFVMTFSCSLQKREKLADQLTLELNRHLLSEADLRRYDRVEAMAGSFTHFTRSTGEQIRCEILDLSLSGVSLRTDLRPPVGEHILVGHRAGRIARHHGEGVGVEFLGLPLTSGSSEPLSPAIAPPPRSIQRTKGLKDAGSQGETDTPVAIARR